MGETRVDLLHLLEDLRDAYTGSLDETVLTEIVANSLDSGATRLDLVTDAASSTLVVRDDGKGMLRKELARFHDIASSSKTRGEGIGFAGVGIKLGLLLCEDVVTETLRGKSHVASLWHLASKHKAPWKWVPPPGRVTDRGTAVTMKLRNPLSPLLDAGFIEASLRRHFLPLFDPAFDDILSAAYPQPLQFRVNGELLGRSSATGAQVSPIEVKLGRKRKPAASGYLVLAALPQPEEARGVAISTLGKVIRRGWEWLGVTPSAPDRIGGVIEVPALAECLTLNKADFIRTGPRGATYLSYRKAIQEVVSRQLGEWGAERDVADTRRRAARPVERDLERVLMDLADDFPLLSSLVERREGGQRRLPFGSGAAPEDGVSAISASVFARAAEGGDAVESGDADATGTNAEDPATLGAGADAESKSAPMSDGTASPADGAAAPAPMESTATITSARGPRKPARYGLAIQFETREGEPELGRLVESTVFVNDAHPAYTRAAASRSEGYHLALAVAMALAPLAVQPHEERAFVMRFLERWGEALAGGGGMRSR